MRNAEYWKQRFTQLEAARYDFNAEAYNGIAALYTAAQRAIEAQIDRWYRRFAKNNAITPAEARRWLTEKELAEFKWDVKDYIKHGEENALSEKWVKELENASARFHISRLEALKINTRQSLESLFSKRSAITHDTISGAFERGYYGAAYELQKGFGVVFDVAKINQAELESVLSKPWAADGYNFSERIWRDKSKLINEVHTELSQNIMLGGDPQKAIDGISKKMNTSRYNAGRLVMTESAYFSSEAQKKCFEDLDVENYEIVATLDSHTSEICRELDGKVFPMKDFKAGVTAPPFHVYCRSTTVPYFDDDFDQIGERAARGADGKTYYVPADMTYREWEKSFVKDVDKSRESGIIKTSGKLTKLSDKGEVLNPMDKTTYSELKSKLEKRGYSVVAATTEDDIGYLKAFGAEAISDEIGIMHLGEIPSASAFYEEIIHLKQIEKYGSLTESNFVERAAREVAANRLLLKNAKVYNFTNTDIADIEVNLGKWEAEFKKKAGVSYDESNFGRGI